MDNLPNRVHCYSGALRAQIAPLFTDYDQVVFFVSLGAVVRLIAPFLKSKDEDGALLIPQRVVTELQGEYSVFVVNTENKIESRRIQISDKYNDYFIVKEGLKTGDHIVLEGLQKVRSGMVVIPVVTTFESQIKTQ